MMERDTRGRVAALLLSAVLCLSGCAGAEGSASPADAASIPSLGESTSADATTATTAAAPAPVRITIDSIGVDSDLMSLGLQPDGSMEVPPGAFPAGWYDGSPSPGELGPAVIAGHVDWAGEPGVFSDLTSLEPADTIAVTREDGSVAAFRVTSVEQYDKDEFPTGSVYGDLDHSGLRLITCGGDFDEGASSYDDNIVAYADLIGIA